MARLPSRTALRALMAVLALAVTVVVAACGEDEEGTSAKPVDSEKVETAYLEGMAGHHESAIEMAKIGKARGQSAFIKNLSDRIVSDQEREIGQMQQIHRRLFNTKLSPDMSAHDGLGLTAQAAGMDHDAETNKMLESANPFDRAFVDEMVPHHNGAVRMSKVVLKDTKDPALRNLAETIIAAQTREVRAMNAFRTRRYGGPVPEKAEAKMDDDKDMESGGGHDGH